MAADKKGHILYRCRKCGNTGCQQKTCDYTMQDSGGKCTKCGAVSTHQDRL